MGELLRRFGSKQVRASGTVGGNIANGSPIGDIAPALIALGGSLRAAQGAVTRELALEDFFIAYGQQARPGEFVRAVRVPKLARRSVPLLQDFQALRPGHFRRHGRVKLRPRGTPHHRRAHRLRRHGGDTEACPGNRAALIGADLADPVAAAAGCAALAADFAPITDQRASAAYRLRVAANLLEKALLEISGASAPTRIGMLHAAE